MVAVYAVGMEEDYTKDSGQEGDNYLRTLLGKLVHWVGWQKLGVCNLITYNCKRLFQKDPLI